MWRIPLADVDLGPDEEAAVLAVLRRRWLSMGEVTAAFEAEFATLTGTPYALAVTNCTAALHLAGLALGWGPGDEVIVPSLTFVATANAVRYCGATPVFADVTGLDDFNLSAEDVAARITPRTRAIIVVHYAGHAADMPALLALARTTAWTWSRMWPTRRGRCSTAGRWARGDESAASASSPTRT